MSLSPSSTLLDKDGNPISSQVSGSQQAVDVGINVAGIQVDPRDVRALTSADQITVAASALPTGAATSANQTTGNASLSSIDSKIVHVDTGAITVAASALPSGAATSALQTSGNSSLSSIDGKLNSLGQKASAASVPVVISTDQSAIPVTSSVAKGALTDASTGTLGSTTSTSVVAANASRKYLFIQNNSGSKIWINFGAAATKDQPSVLLAANGGAFAMEGEFVSTDQIFAIGQSGSNLALTIKYA